MARRVCGQGEYPPPLLAVAGYRLPAQVVRFRPNRSRSRHGLRSWPERRATG